MNGRTCVKFSPPTVVFLAIGAYLAVAQHCIADPPAFAPLPQPELYGYVLGNPTVHRYALPYIYAYAPPRVASRVASILDRYVPSIAIAPPLAPRPVAPYPYSPYANPPTGYEKIWTSANSYVYRPLYSQAPAVAGAPAAGRSEASGPPKPQSPTLAQPRTPTLASPATRPDAVPAGFASTDAGASAIASVPEVIPTPPAEGSLVKAAAGQQGPREF